MLPNGLLLVFELVTPTIRKGNVKRAGKVLWGDPRLAWIGIYISKVKAKGGISVDLK